MRVKYNQLNAATVHQQFANRLLEQVDLRLLVNTQKQGTVGFDTEEDLVIDRVLSDRLLKIRQFRESEKALHLDRDLPRAFLGSEDLLRPKVDIHVLLSPPDVERVVGDRPTIPDQGVLDLVVILITRGHHIDPWKLSADRR